MYFLGFVKHFYQNKNPAFFGRVLKFFIDFFICSMLFFLQILYLPIVALKDKFLMFLMDLHQVCVPARYWNRFPGKSIYRWQHKFQHEYF
jgi:hypothetical protein